MDIFVARQPVFTRKKKVFGYELLFRLDLENIFPEINGDTATANVLTNTFFTFELNEILAGKPGLVNFTRNLILQNTPLLFPKEHIIIEVLENIVPEPEVLESLRVFKRKGFRIALDDFVYDPKFDPMISFCSIIKFDIIETPLDSIAAIITDIRSNHNISLLAEKVETHQQYEQARAMGFDLFQGYFFEKPEIFTKKDVSSNQIIKMRLINELWKKDLELETIENLIKKDLSVSYKLLKFLNSAYYRRPIAINTIKDAIIFLGTDELKKFIHVIAISDLNENKPNELIRSSVIRARMCELCGEMLKTQFSSEELFTVGLFSSMDAILDRPMKEILPTIAFSNKIKDALLGKDKQYSILLMLVTNFEKGHWNHRLYKMIDGKKIAEKLPDFYLDAIRLADSFFT
jgi:c-di-GMP-related signal transduction protein